MKRLFVFFLIFALFAAPAFAQMALNGSFDVHAILAQGDTETKADPTTGMGSDLTLVLSGETANGLFGAKGALGRAYSWWAYGWWKPMDMVMVKMGAIYEDSTWAGADLVGWGLNNNDFVTRPTADFAAGLVPEGIGFFSSKMGRYEKRAMQLSVYPIEGLAINLGFPMQLGSMAAGATDNAAPNIAENTYIKQLHAQIVYDLGMGEAALGFVNGFDKNDTIALQLTSDVGMGNQTLGAIKLKTKDIFVQWKMPIGDAMRIEFGLNYGLYVDDSYSPPINVGLGFGMGSFENEDQLIVNARVGAIIPMQDGEDPRIGLDVVLSYDLEMFRLYVPVGVSAYLGDETTVYWSFCPYIAKDLGGPFFYAGIQLYNDAKDDAQINWKVPVGFRWDF
ncbi:MAG: hypothetical protein LBH43_20470 [Treponema sp.]|nr:hypothetical protein [Treponema sp.]